MSKNRENVIWQSENGTWNIGFYLVVAQYNAGEAYDDEWEVDYDWDTFQWVSVGHLTAASAEASWRGPNPGGTTIVRYLDNEEPVAHYDLMATYYLNPALKIQAEKEANEAKNKSHFEALKEEFEKHHRYVGAKVRVTTADPATVHTSYGLTTSYTGVLKQKGEWLTVVDWDMEDVPVFNLVKETFAPNIHGIRQEISRGRW